LPRSSARQSSAERWSGSSADRSAGDRSPRDVDSIKRRLRPSPRLPSSSSAASSPGTQSPGYWRGAALEPRRPHYCAPNKTGGGKGAVTAGSAMVTEVTVVLPDERVDDGEAEAGSWTAAGVV